MKSLNVLGICGSLRVKSTNRGLLQYAQAHAPAGLKIKLANISAVPFYNADISDKPPSVQQLLSDFEQADALLLACPEYNYSLAPALKNALDWASREPDNRLLSGKPAALLGAGGGMGTSRSQYHLRQVSVFLNLHLLNRPEIFCNAFDGSFDEGGNLINEKIQGLIRDQLKSLLQWSRKLRVQETVE